ncbi:MAG: MFS transporter [Lachnospiraceae bacterium]|nr:MFS transporter [Lachnospiraceae bacterium]
MDRKLTKLEKSWILYDVGNSAFVLLAATILPIYFNYLADSAGLSSVDYLAYWGYAASVVTVIVALIGPVFGTIADYKNFKKPLFLAFLIVGAGGCLALGLCHTWLSFLIIFIIAKTGYSATLVFYDSMLTDVTTEDRLDRVSSQGYAWGYIGSCIPFLVSLLIVLGKDVIGISMTTAMLISFAIVSVWWFAVTVPLLKNYRQIHYMERQPRAVADSFRRLGHTLRGLKEKPRVLLFLLAYFFYIDGVYTIIDMATAYGTALGLDTTGLLLALLVTQIVAFPSAIAFGRLSAKYASDRLILVCIAAYTGIAVFAMFMSTQVHFWILAVCVGLFQGGVQALSRSHFAKIIPAENSGEYFGLLDICGKGASFMGTTLVGAVSQATGKQSLGIGVLVVVFVLGMVLFVRSVRAAEAGTKQG